MKQHALITVLAVLTALLLLIPAVLCVFAFALPAQYTETFLGELPCKMERLRNAEGPRIILVGGSSVPFSIKSELIEASFPEYTAVDFGLYAELGTPIMLDWLDDGMQYDLFSAASRLAELFGDPGRQAFLNAAESFRQADSE